MAINIKREKLISLDLLSIDLQTMNAPKIEGKKNGWIMKRNNNKVIIATKSVWFSYLKSRWRESVNSNELSSLSFLNSNAN